MKRISIAEIEIRTKTADYLELDILGLPYYGPFQGKDAHREFLTPRTRTEKFVGDTIPTTYFHGFTPEGVEDKNPEFFGKAELTKYDNRGGWFRTRIDMVKTNASRIAKAAVDGTLRASTGLAGDLRRVLQTGELTLWVPGELAIVDQAYEKQPTGGYPRVVANNLAIGMPALKMLYKHAKIEWPRVFELREKQASTRRIRLVLSKDKKK